MKRGKFIVFEGIDGSGKTYQSKLLLDYLRNEFKTQKFAWTNEPTNGEIGDFARSFLDGRREPITEEALTLLMTADRMEHIKHVDDLLNEGTNVICDRYFYSSLAYNSGEGGKKDLEWVRGQNKYAIKKLPPDCVIFIDVFPEECIRRINSNRDHVDLMENLERLTQARNNYFLAFDEFMKYDSTCYTIINGNQTKENVFKAITKLPFFFKVFGMGRNENDSI